MKRRLKKLLKILYDDEEIELLERFFENLDKTKEQTGIRYVIRIKDGDKFRTIDKDGYHYNSINVDGLPNNVVGVKVKDNRKRWLGSDDMMYVDNIDSMIYIYVDKANRHSNDYERYFIERRTELDRANEKAMKYF